MYPTISALYLQWLKGKTLRQLAQECPKRISHGAIAIWFHKAFGADSTNPQAMSLQRSLLEDYPDEPPKEVLDRAKKNPAVIANYHRTRQQVEKWVLRNLDLRADTQHRSNHSIGQLTKFQVVHEPEMMEFLAVAEEYHPEPEPLRLPGFMLLVDTLVSILRGAYAPEEE